MGLFWGKFRDESELLRIPLKAMAKKVDVDVIFNQIVLLPNRRTMELSSELEKLCADGNILVSWFEKEKSLSEKERMTHLDSITLEIAPSRAFEFKTTLSSGSYYSIPFSKFKRVDDLQLSYSNGKLTISGSISMKFGVKDVVFDDFVNSQLVHFKSLSIRPQGSGELLVFDKYGTLWEEKKADQNDFGAGLSEQYISGLPLVEVM